MTTLEDKAKWAVENVNTESGLRVRLIETPQEWTAQLFHDKANEYFKAHNRPVKSVIIRLK